MIEDLLEEILPFLLVAVFVSALVFGIKGYYKEKEKLETNYEIVKGVVIKSRRVYRQGVGDNVITFRFNVNGTTYERTKSFDVLLKAGEQCTVQYFVDNPKNCKLIESEKVDEH